tara:strand:+ start:102 stop:746 length:645 start_codon:yes stop_codon:yes gene_type:complete
MSHSVIESGTSRSFPGSHKLLQSAQPNGDVLILIGVGAAAALGGIRNRDAKTAIVVELGTECLGVHTGESRGEEGSNVLGFARYRLGNDAPTDLIELVRQPGSKPEAIAAAKAVFEDCGLTVAVCNDFPGRIVDRLIRPYFNAALKRLDEKLASAEDMDLTLRLGLGYPEGPISLLERTGLAAHHDVSKALYEALGQQAYVPARRARVAKQRQI